MRSCSSQHYMVVESEGIDPATDSFPRERSHAVIGYTMKRFHLRVSA